MNIIDYIALHESNETLLLLHIHQKHISNFYLNFSNNVCQETYLLMWTEVVNK